MLKIYKNNSWIEITDLIIIDSYKKFIKSSDDYDDNIIFINSGFYKYYIIIDDIKYPIADWDNVYVFLYDIDKPNWIKARSYQTWAFYDFIYKNDNSILYASKNSNLLNYIELQSNARELPFDDLENNIIFTMHYNENNSISYEKNDIYKTNIRISNNNNERSYYLGFYNRMTSDIF